MTDPSRGVEDSNLADSGYVSLANSPDGKDSTNRGASQSSNPQPCPLPSRTTTSSLLGGLKRFEKDVDPAALDRFKDVVERVQDPLIRYLRKRYDLRDFQPMAIRLIVLGETYDDAKPQIVVFSPEKVLKRVKKFFAQRSIASICRPSDFSQISFEITFIGRPPRPKNASTIEVYGASNLSALVGWTSSSTLIRVTRDDGDRYATMGGIIKIVKTDQDFVLCGLTVGHILEQEERECTHDDICSTPDLSCSLDVSSEEESDGDDDMLDVGTVAEPDDSLHRASIPANVRFGTSWARVGKITAKDRSAEARNRDWALIEDVDKQLQRPNMIQERSADYTKQPARQLALINNTPITAGSRRRVLIVASGSLHGGYSHAGLLSALPTMALLPAGTRFVPVYTIALDDNSELPDGSSGSWVIGEHSCEVYGHVVADDPFGDVFVVPFTDIIDDIKNAVGAQAVTLPSEIDVFSHLSRDMSQALLRSSGQASEQEVNPIERNFEPALQQFLSQSPSATEDEMFANRKSNDPPPTPSPTTRKATTSSSTGTRMMWGLATPNPSPQRSHKLFAGSHTLSMQPAPSAPPPAPSIPCPKSPPVRPTKASQTTRFRKASSSPKMAPAILSSYVSNYFRASSPLTSTFTPYACGGNLSPPPESPAASHEATRSPPSKSAHSVYQRPFGSHVPSPAPVFSNINNPSGQLPYSMMPGMMQGFNSGHAAGFPHLPGYGINQQPATDRPFKCDQCPQSFNRNHDLKRHKRIHLAVKPFPCTHCDKSFSRKDALKRHILVKGCGSESSIDAHTKAHETVEKRTNDSLQHIGDLVERRSLFASVPIQGSGTPNV